MLRTVIRRLEGDLITSYVNPNQLNTVFCQSVRWRRKPRWLPTAKSKLFRVPERPKIPLEEQEELMRLYNNYRTELKSIREFFAEQIETAGNKENVVTTVEEDEGEHKKCIELNEQWNAEIRLLKEDTLAKEKEAELEEILKTIEENKIKMEQRKQEVEEIVRKEKERAKTYITPENIDEAIDKVLENTVDYNFSIDLKGNFYHGRNTKPSKVSSEPEVQEEEVTAAAA